MYEQYLKVDRRLTGAPRTRFAVDCGRLLEGVDRIEVEPLVKGFSHRFPDDVLERIRAARLDVLLRFGFNILKGPILTTARYGVWSYHHGDNEYYRGGPAMFWELREQSITSGVILQVLTEELDAGQVLSKAIFRTEPGLSLSRDCVAPYWGAADMVIQKLQEPTNPGWRFTSAAAWCPPSVQRQKKDLPEADQHSGMVQWLIPALAGKAVRRLARMARGSRRRNGASDSAATVHCPIRPVP